MRLDIFAIKAIVSFEQRLIKQFGNRSSLLVVSATAVCAFMAVLFWTVEQDAGAEVEMVAASQQVPPFTVKESAAADPSDSELFSYALVGSSECIHLEQEYSYTPGLSVKLGEALAENRNCRVTSYDFCRMGGSLERKYQAVAAASLLDVDLIVVTHPVFATTVLTGKNPSYVVSDINDSGGVVAYLHDTPPAVAIERLLSSKFTNYGNRFERSLAPLLAPGRFEIVRANVQNRVVRERVEEQRTVRLLSDSALSDSVDSEIVSRLQADSFLHPGEAFELIARPAIEKNIPLLFVITPVDEAIAPRNVMTSVERFQKLLPEAQGYIKKNFDTVRIWPAYEEDILLTEDFLDFAHIGNFDSLAARIVEVLDQEGFLPNE